MKRKAEPVENCIKTGHYTTILLPGRPIVLTFIYPIMQCLNEALQCISAGALILLLSFFNVSYCPGFSIYFYIFLYVSMYLKRHSVNVPIATPLNMKQSKSSSAFTHLLLAYCYTISAYFNVSKMYLKCLKMSLFALHLLYQFLHFSMNIVPINIIGIIRHLCLYLLNKYRPALHYSIFICNSFVLFYDTKMVKKC